MVEADKTAVCEGEEGETEESAVVAVGLGGFEDVAGEDRSLAAGGFAEEVVIQAGPGKVGGQLEEVDQVEAAEPAAVAAAPVLEVQRVEAQEADVATEMGPLLLVGPFASPAFRSTG